MAQRRRTSPSTSRTSRRRRTTAEPLTTTSTSTRSSADGDGTLLVSARHTHAIYKIRKRDGAIVWRLGGKKSDFALGPGATLRLAARRAPHAGRDDHALRQRREPPAEGRGVARSRPAPRRDCAETATLVRSYAHPTPLLSTSQGNAQFLPDGHVFVGWGSNEYFTEFDRAGACCSTGASAAAAPTRTAPTGSPGRPPVRPKGGRRRTGKATALTSTPAGTAQPLSGADRVEPGERLVEDQQIRVVHEGGGELHPLLVAEREPDVVAAPVGDAEPLDPVRWRPPRALGARPCRAAGRSRRAGRRPASSGTGPAPRACSRSGAARPRSIGWPSQRTAPASAGRAPPSRSAWWWSCRRRSDRRTRPTRPAAR